MRSSSVDAPPPKFGSPDGHTPPPQVLEILLGAGANPSLPAAGGSTAATAAAANGHLDALALLEAAGADLTAAGSEGHPPLYYVLQRGLVQLRDAPSPFGPAAEQATRKDCGEGCAKELPHLHRLLEAVPWPLTPPCHPRITHLIASSVAHPGAGSAIIDDALPAEVLDQLDR